MNIITPEDVVVGKRLANAHKQNGEEISTLEAYFTIRSGLTVEEARSILKQYGANAGMYVHELLTNWVWIYLHIGYHLGSTSDASLDSADLQTIQDQFLLFVEMIPLMDTYVVTSPFSEDIRFITNYFDTTENFRQLTNDMADIGYKALLTGYLIGARPTIIKTNIVLT
jgi:hypothetical protein